MPETEQFFGTYPIAFQVGEPSPTWFAMSPLVGAGQITIGSYSVITPISITLVA